MGQLIAEYSTAAQTSAGGTSYLTEDALGTPRVVTGANRNILARHDYLPFGEDLYFDGSRPSVRTSAQMYVGDNVRQKFTSKERDNESGLDYSGKRYYGSTLGRWSSPDPQGIAMRHLLNPQKLNKYSYILNNPSSFIDLDGMEEVTLVYRAFIPQEQIHFMGLTFRGDNRGFSSAPNASSRSSITVVIETDASKRPGNPIISQTSRAGQSEMSLPIRDEVKDTSFTLTYKATAKTGLPVATGDRDVNGNAIINIQQDAKVPVGAPSC